MQQPTSNTCDYASSLSILPLTAERDLIGRMRSESEVPYTKSSTLITTGSKQNTKMIEQQLKSTRSASRKQHTLASFVLKSLGADIDSPIDLLQDRSVPQKNGEELKLDNDMDWLSSSRQDRKYSQSERRLSGYIQQSQTVVMVDNAEDESSAAKTDLIE